MRKILICILLLLCGQIFSQSDSVYKTEGVFSITYVNSLKKISHYENIKLTYIDSNYLRFESSIIEQGRWVPHSYKVTFDKINSFGYKAHASSAQIIGTGALIGFGTGFILGCIAGRVELGAHTNSKGPVTFGERLGTGLGFGLLLAIPALVISACIPANPYENVEISKYDVKKKFEIIRRLIKTGVKANL